MKPKLNKILISVCQYYGVNTKVLSDKNRTKNVNECRQMFFYLAYSIYRYKCQEVGDLIDKDHATVLHACRKIEYQERVYSEIKNAITIIKSRIENISIVLQDIDLLKISENYTQAITI